MSEPCPNPQPPGFFLSSAYLQGGGDNFVYRAEVPVPEHLGLLPHLEHPRLGDGPEHLGNLDGEGREGGEKENGHSSSAKAARGETFMIRKWP